MGICEKRKEKKISDNGDASTVLQVSESGEGEWITRNGKKRDAIYFLRYESPSWNVCSPDLS